MSELPIVRIVKVSELASVIVDRCQHRKVSELAKIGIGLAVMIHLPSLVLASFQALNQLKLKGVLT